jgi:CBS domain-containing protein
MKSKLTVKDVMNENVLYVREDMTVRELAAFLAENEITGAPVLNAAGRMTGVVSVTDVAENEAKDERAGVDRAHADYYVRGWEDKMNPEDLRGLQLLDEDVLVRDIMTPTVYTVPENTPVGEVARTMVAGRIHRLLVTREERVVGIVTTLDLLRLLS